MECSFLSHAYSTLEEKNTMIATMKSITIQVLDVELIYNTYIEQIILYLNRIQKLLNFEHGCLLQNYVMRNSIKNILTLLCLQFILTGLI